MRVDLFLKRNWRFLGFILVSAIIITGAYTASFYRNQSKPGPTVEAATGLNNYTVKNGDSVFSIAGKFGVSIAALEQVNGIDTKTINPGQILTIPDEPSGDWYTVKNGDSLYYIASKYDVTIEAIQKSNALHSSLIIPRQVLVIPPVKKQPVQPLIVKSVSAPQVQHIPLKDTNQSLSLKDTNRPLAEVLKEKGLNNPWSRISILVDKSDHTLSLYIGGTHLKSYPVELGDGGLGDKCVQGDHRTPEGNFYVAERSVLKPADQFLGTRWLRLSYPNIEDADRGVLQGLIDQKTHDAIIEAWKNKAIPPQYTPLGGGVGIHGGNSKGQGSNWTWGCVGLSNQDIEDFFDYIAVGTPIVIRK